MRGALWVVSFLTLPACCDTECDDGADADPNETDTDTTGGVISFDAEAVLSDVVSTVAFVTWTPPVDGDSWVEVGLDDAEPTRITPIVATTHGVSHEQVVLGLKTERTYRWRAVTEAGDERYVSPEASLTTGVRAPGASEVDVFTDLRDQQDPAPYLLTATGIPSAIVVYDRDGDIVWSYAVTGSEVREVVTVRPGWDGRSVVYALYDQVQDADTGGIYRVSMDGRATTFTSTVDAHHDFVERQDGTFAYLSQDYREQVAVTGVCNPARAEIPDCAVADVVADVVVEIAEGAALGTAGTTVYNHFDDSGDTPFWTCVDMERPFPDPDGTHHQWTHGNSLVPDPIDPENVYWINLRFQDALVKVSRTHELLGVIGGWDTANNIEPPEDRFDHGHVSHLWPGGFLMFDNNTHDDALDPNVSRVREYTFDPATNGDVTLVHEWPGAAKTGGMADARKTRVGTVLINWAIEKKVQEITTDGVIVWGVHFAGTAPGRMVLLDDLYALNPPYEDATARSR